SQTRKQRSDHEFLLGQYYAICKSQTPGPVRISKNAAWARWGKDTVQRIRFDRKRTARSALKMRFGFWFKAVWLHSPANPSPSPAPQTGKSVVLRAHPGRALQPPLAQVGQRLVGLVERIAHHFRPQPAHRRDRQELAGVGAGQVGDRDDLPL